MLLLSCWAENCLQDRASSRSATGSGRLHAGCPKGLLKIPVSTEKAVLAPHRHLTQTWQGAIVEIIVVRFNLNFSFDLFIKDSITTLLLCWALH